MVEAAVAEVATGVDVDEAGDDGELHAVSRVSSDITNHLFV